MEHVVREPAPPFTTADGRLEVHQVPAARDNLVWVLICRDTREAAIVDGPSAEGALACIAREGARLTTVLNTHTHGDHVGVNVDLDQRGLLDGLVVAGPAGAADDVPGITRPVSEGDSVRVGNVQGRVLLTEGHLDGHVSFLFDDVLFCGDTLFTGGCGYLFDGPPSKMQASLARLASLPDGTRVCCAHEYTQDNLRFAWFVEPDNAALATRIRRVWALRARGGCAVPSTMGEERATNPFLRWESATLRATVSRAVGGPLDDALSVFTATRALKDRGPHKAAGDAPLPL